MTAKQYLTKCIRYASNTNQTDAPYCHCGAYAAQRTDRRGKRSDGAGSVRITGDMKMFGR